MRVALNDAAPLYRDAPEAREARASGDRAMQVFMREALPEASECDARLGRRPDHDDAEQGRQALFGKSRSPAEIEAYADAMADMFCAYLESLAKGSGVLSRDLDPEPEDVLR